MNLNIMHTLFFACAVLQAMDHKNHIGSLFDFINSSHDRTLMLMTNELSNLSLSEHASIEWCKEYLHKNGNAKKNLESLFLKMPRLENPDVSLAKILLYIGCSANAGDEDLIIYENPGATILNIAAGHGHIELVQLLLDHHADIESRDPENEFTPLMNASTHGHTEVVKVLLKNKANVNASTKRLHTALLLAANEGHEEISKLLIDAGADVTVRDECGESVLDKTKDAEFRGSSSVGVHKRICDYIAKAQKS